MSYVTDRFDDKVVSLLRSGGVGFMPSDTIYGLSCAALNKSAVEKLHKIKERQSHKPFIVLIADLEMLDLLSIDKTQATAIQKYWPGALSVVFNSPRIPAWLQLGTDSLAVRLPAQPELWNLISQVGPLISTSANLAGGRPVSSADEARRLFGQELDFYVDSGKIEGQPSTLVAIADGKIKVLREGAVKISGKGQP